MCHFAEYIWFNNLNLLLSRTYNDFPLSQSPQELQAVSSTYISIPL